MEPIETPNATELKEQANQNSPALTINRLAIAVEIVA